MIMGFEFQYFFQYLWLSWSPGAGEFPTFIHLIAFVLTLISFFILVLIDRSNANARAA